MTEKQYNNMVKEMSPKSPIGKDCRNAFLIGGLICTIGQVFINLYTKLGYDHLGAPRSESKSIACQWQAHHNS